MIVELYYLVGCVPLSGLKLLVLIYYKFTRLLYQNPFFVAVVLIYESAMVSPFEASARI